VQDDLVVEVDARTDVVRDDGDDLADLRPARAAADVHVPVLLGEAVDLRRAIPASAITSASPSFWHVMPTAPAFSCMRASRGTLCVFTCGLKSKPCSSQ